MNGASIAKRLMRWPGNAVENDKPSACRASKPRRAGGRQRWLVAVLATGLCSIALSAGQGPFSGKVVLEVLDEIEFVHKVRLREDFAFTDAQGKVWLARKGAILSGESVPRELYALEGLPYPAEYRRAAVVYDHFCAGRTEPWRQVDRMFYFAGLAEGLSEAQAKALYAVVYAGGWRWEPQGSGCYRSCHAAAASLAWKPAADASQMQPVLHWILQSGPTLDAIDARLDSDIKRPGPHLFAQP